MKKVAAFLFLQAVAEDGESTWGSKVSLGRRAGVRNLALSSSLNLIKDVCFCVFLC